jgi:hypothetical protein
MRFLAALLLSLWLASVVRADDAAVARYHFERGVEHYQAGLMRDAIAEFLLSNRISPNPRVVFNIAQAFFQLREAESAFDYYVRYLAMDDPLDENGERHAIARADLAQLERSVARVRITSDPPGATIFVDNEEHGSYGRTPRVVALPAGSRRLIVRLDGHHAREATVEARTGREESVTLELERVLGALELLGEAGATVQVLDERDREVAEGTTPTTFALPPGRYRARVVDERFVAADVNVVVEPESTTRTTLPMRRRPPPTGELVLSSNAPGALVSLDGEEVGFSPVVLPRLEEGPHRLRIEQEGLQAWEDTLQVRRDERLWVTATLTAPPRVERTPASFAIGAVGLGALVGAAVTGPMALLTRARFDDARLDDPERAISLRERGVFLNRTTDVLLAIGAVALTVGVTLFFVTERRVDAPSSVSVSRRPR